MCRIHLFKISFFIVIFITLSHSFISNTEANDSISVVKSTTEELILKVQLGKISDRKISVDDHIYSFITADGWQVQPVPGEAFLPEKIVIAAIPPEGDIEFHWQGKKIEFYQNVTLITPCEDHLTQKKIRKYTRTDFKNHPIQVVTHLKNGWVGFNRITGFRISPFQYDFDKKVLKIFHELFITIKFRNSLVGKRCLSNAHSSFIENLVINPNVALIFQRKITTDDQDRKSFWYDPNLDWYKISISEDGVYRITNQIDLSNVDPRSICMFNKGQIVPIIISGEEDGVFNSGDYIEFYGQAYRDRIGDTEKYTKDNIYWLTWRDIPASRYIPIDGCPVTAPSAESYEARIHMEDNFIYYNKEFFWKKLNLGETERFSFSISHIQRSVAPAKISFRFFGVTDLPDVDFDHVARIFLNEKLVYTAYWRAWNECRVEFEIPSNDLSEGLNQIRVGCPIDSKGYREFDTFLIDWFEISYPREYRAFQTKLDFSKHIGPGQGVFSYRIEGFTFENIILYRTDLRMRIENSLVFPSVSGYCLLFSQFETPDIHFLAVTEDEIKTPDKIWKDKPSDLKDVSNQADYIFISHANYFEPLNELIDHKKRSGTSVKLVDIEDIYDEFNDGIFNPEAIRQFIQYAYYHWMEPKPQAVLLVGDASWDYLNQLPTSTIRNEVPSYGKDWYDTKAEIGLGRNTSRHQRTSFIYGDPMVDDQFVTIVGDDNLPDLMIGRITPHSPEEAVVIVDKVLQYAAQKRDLSWQKNLLFITGGENDGEQNIFINQSQNIINDIVRKNGCYWHPVEINKTTDDHSWGIYEDDIIAAIDSGMLLVNFLGHAGTWSWEAMFDFDDISRLNNKGILPFIGSFTCNTCRFANPEINSFCEEFLNTETSSKGCIAAWGGCNFGGFWTDYYLAYYFYDYLFTHRTCFLGEAVMAAKITALLRYPSYAVIIEPYTLLGDPMIMLKTPSAPHVELAGSLDSRITQSEGGQFIFWAIVTDPDGPDHIQSVELVIDGLPTGLFLSDDGRNGDVFPSDGVYSISIPIPEGLECLSYTLGIKCTDTEGNIGSSFPRLTIEP